MWSVKPATWAATASPEATATSALTCASLIAGGPVRSLLQATAPAARNIAAAVRMGFLNFIKACAPESVFAPQRGCYEHEGAGKTKRAARPVCRFAAAAPIRAFLASSAQSAGAQLHADKLPISTGRRAS